MSLIYHVNILSQSVGTLSLDLPKRKTLTNLFRAVASHDKRETLHQLYGLSVKKINKLKDIYKGRWTILFFAVFEHDFEIAGILLSKGANPNVCGKLPRSVGVARTVSPLQCAIVQYNVQLIKLLLDHGASVNIPLPDFQYEEEGALMHYTSKSNLYKAIQSGSIEIVKLLLQHEKTVNLMDVSGQSALDLACECPVMVIKLLVRYGAKTSYKHGDINSNGFSCLVYDSLMGTDKCVGIQVKYVELVRFVLASEYNNVGSSSHQALMEVYESISSELDPQSQRHSSSVLYDFNQYIQDYIQLPSSLKQITRATIRSHLGVNCRPEIIEGLPLPNLLQRYLNIEDD